MVKNKKSQIIGQIFIYILVAVVVGGIVLVGYWAIKSILQKSCEVEQINFKIDFEKMLSKSNTFGSTSIYSLVAPCEYNKVCLVDASRIGSSTFTCSANLIVENSVKDNQTMNIFLANTKKTYPVGFSEYLVLDNPNSCLCVNSTNGRFPFKFEGRGQTTLVKTNAYGTS